MRRAYRDRCAGLKRRQQPEQMLPRQGDAAFRWREASAGDMQEDGAAASFLSRPSVVIEHGDDVVNRVVAPKAFGACAIGQRHFAVVVPVARRVAPAEDWLKRLDPQRGSWAHNPVWPVIDFGDGPDAQRRRSVAFSFPGA
jgi:hypothetical protein